MGADGASSMGRQAAAPRPGAWLGAVLWTVLLALSGGAACSSGKGKNFCESNADCPVGASCLLAEQRCICERNEACAEGEFCNSSGSCQALSGCQTNNDCDDDNYCDLATGRCICAVAVAEDAACVAGPPQLGSVCGIDVHCGPGQICDDDRCVAGCRDGSDCGLGEICRAGECLASSADGTMLVCDDESFCPYGALCSDDRCAEDNRGPYCRACSQRTVINPDPCDGAKNFCLIDSSAPGASNICGVDCSGGEGCPSGYNCTGVVILSEEPCTANAQCQCRGSDVSFATATCTTAVACDPQLPGGGPDPSGSCTEVGHPNCNPGVEDGLAACVRPAGATAGQCTCDRDSQCPDGARCVSGLCCAGGMVEEDRTCAVGEGNVSGFCLCATDDDCPANSCDPGRGVCSLTGEPCTPGGGECQAVPCVGGGCVIGRNCAPQAGLLCSELLSTP